MNREKTNDITLKYRATRATLSLLVVGFSLIAIINACKFLIVLFGLSMGILISSTIEVTRLSCLFIFVRKGKGIKALAIVTYLVVASVSSWSNINAFSYEMVKREMDSHSHYRPQIHQIKQEYCRRVAERATGVADEIIRIEKILSSYPNSAIWKRRLATTMAQRDSLVAERDAFLKEEPVNPDQWIRIQSALLGITFPAVSPENENVDAVTRTLNDLWGIGKTQAQRMMGIIITGLVELSILLLSFITAAVTRPHPTATPATGGSEIATPPVARTTPTTTPNKNLATPAIGSSIIATPPVAQTTPTTTPNKNLATPATGGSKIATPPIDMTTLERFIATHKPYWMKTGHLPQTKNLSRKFREIRKKLIGLPLKEMEAIFENEGNQLD